MNLEADYTSLKGQFDAMRAALALGEASDGYHTHNELYRYRMLYNALTALAFDAAGWRTVRSTRHSDGEECFGGGWFVVHAETPAGQITNHYQSEHWHLFNGIASAARAPEWDGHTPEIAAQRLEAAIEFLRDAFVRSVSQASLRQDAEWLLSETGWPHYRNCDVEQCDTCSEVLGIDERLTDGGRKCR